MVSVPLLIRDKIINKDFLSLDAPLKLRGIIGSGGFGTVYEALYIPTRKLIALKVLMKDDLREVDIEIIKDRLEVMKSRLLHHSIVEYFGLWEGTDCIYVGMELLQGGSLREYLITKHQNKRSLEEREVSQAMKQIISGIDFLHRKDTLHRDIKLENIIFGKKGDFSTLKIVDFGLSTRSDPRSVDRIDGACGTFLYMAPEVLQKKSYTKSVDIFSAGIVMYKLLSNYKSHPLWKGNMTHKEYIDKLEYFPKPLPQGIQPKISKLCYHLLCRMISFKPIERYTAQEVLDHPWITRSIGGIPQTSLEMIYSGCNTKTLNIAYKLVLFLGIVNTQNRLDSEYIQRIRENSNLVEEWNAGRRKTFLENGDYILEENSPVLKRSNKLEGVKCKIIKLREMKKSVGVIDLDSINKWKTINNNNNSSTNTSNNYGVSERKKKYPSSTTKKKKTFPEQELIDILKSINKRKIAEEGGADLIDVNQITQYPCEPPSSGLPPIYGTNGKLWEGNAISVPTGHSVKRKGKRSMSYIAGTKRKLLSEEGIKLALNSQVDQDSQHNISQNNISQNNISQNNISHTISQNISHISSQSPNNKRPHSPPEQRKYRSHSVVYSTTKSKKQDPTTQEAVNTFSTISTVDSSKQYGMDSSPRPNTKLRNYSNTLKSHNLNYKYRMNEKLERKSSNLLFPKVCKQSRCNKTGGQEHNLMEMVRNQMDKKISNKLLLPTLPPSRREQEHLPIQQSKWEYDPPIPIKKQGKQDKQNIFYPGRNNYRINCNSVQKLEKEIKRIVREHPSFAGRQQASPYLLVNSMNEIQMRKLTSQGNNKTFLICQGAKLV